jgi:hypothetical protein
MSFAPTDELAHAAEADPWWEETWLFELVAEDVAAFTRLAVLPNQGRAWYWASLFRPGRPELHLLELDLRAPAGLDVRGEGIWASHVCEEPFEQWTVANEAYAVAVEEQGRGGNGAESAHPPLNVLRGSSEPFAFDLEWYAAGPASPLEEVAGYVQPGEVNAVIELRGGPLHAEAASTRAHWWGRPPAGGAPPLGSSRFGTHVVVDGSSGRQAIHRALVGASWLEWRTGVSQP